MYEWRELGDRVLYLIPPAVFSVVGWALLRYIGRHDRMRTDAEEARAAEIKKHSDEISKLRTSYGELDNRVCHIEWQLKIEPPSSD
jgi:hypothetical protein